MKRLSILLIPFLVLTLLMCAIGCDDDDDETAKTPSTTTETTEPTAQPAGRLKIGVIGPMEFIQGEHHWAGAQMAAEEINAVGGVNVDGQIYTIDLVRADSNELLNPADAVTAMERLITRDGADFVMGGIRSEAVLAMQDIAMDHRTIFLGCGASDAELNVRVKQDYDRYKYWFRVGPFTGLNLIQDVMQILGMAGAIVQQDFALQEPLKVAIIAEQAVWADPAVAVMKGMIPAKLGMEVVNVWRPSSTAADVSAELNAIEDSGAHFVVPILSGPVGIPYGKKFGEMDIPAASIGINVEAQKLGYWEATGGKADYDTILNFYAPGIAITEKTVSWVEDFMERFDELPTYNAMTYDATMILRAAIERAGTLDADAVVAELEKTDYVGTGARFVFTPVDNPQPHDLTYGPGYATGIGVQWRDGEMKAIWPNLGADEWEGLVYEGTVTWQIPPLLRDRLTGQ